VDAHVASVAHEMKARGETQHAIRTATDAIKQTYQEHTNAGSLDESTVSSDYMTPIKEAEFNNNLLSPFYRHFTVLHQIRISNVHALSKYLHPPWTYSLT